MSRYTVRDNNRACFTVDIHDDLKRAVVRGADPGPFGITVDFQRVFTGGPPVGVHDGSQPPPHDTAILLELNTPDTYTYMYIGSEIFTFKTLSPVETYTPVRGFSDVLYPYAVDCSDRAYLLVEGVVLERWSPSSQYATPYDYYRRACLVTHDLDNTPPLFTFRDICGFRIGSRDCFMRYTPTPAQDYMSFSDNGRRPVTCEFRNGTVENLSLDDYVKLMNDFGEFAGFSPLSRLATIVSHGGSIEELAVHSV